MTSSVYAVLALLLTLGVDALTQSQLDWVWPKQHAECSAVRTLAPDQPLWRRSSQLGIQHCSLHGVIGNDTILLHIWAKAVLLPLPAGTFQGRDMGTQANADSSTGGGTPAAEAGGSRLVLKGFAFLEDAEDFNAGRPYYQISHARGALSNFSHSFSLRSPASGNLWNITTSPPSHMTAALSLAADIHISQEEVEWGDLEVRASGLSFFCRLPLTPPGPVTDVKPGSETTSASNTQGSSTTRTLKSTSTSSTSQHDAPTHCSSSPHGDGNTSNSTWLQGASLQGGCTRFVFLLSPFYYRPAAEAITLLLHHMAWHSRLGFCSYLWYITEQPGVMVRDERVQALVRAGRLELVLWDELPHHEHGLGKANNWDAYAYQALILSHAVLSRWGADEVVASADLDEYLLTATPGASILQAWRDCPSLPKHKRPAVVAGLAVRRVDAVCMNPSLCGPTHTSSADPSISRPVLMSPSGAQGGVPHDAQHPTPSMATWMSWPIPSASQEGGSSTSTSFPKQQQQPALYLHPLSLYDFASTYSLSAYPNQKPLVDPAHLATMMIHTFVNTNSTDVQLVDTGCARWIHLVNLHRARVREAQPAGLNHHIPGATQPSTSAAGQQQADWWWPLNEMV